MPVNRGAGQVPVLDYGVVHETQYFADPLKACQPGFSGSRDAALRRD